MANGGRFGKHKEFRLSSDCKWFACVDPIEEDRVYAVSFVVYETIGVESNTGEVLFPKDDSSQPLEGDGQPLPFLSGEVKWDGCSNWDFDIQDRCMLHFCGKGEAAGIGGLFEWLYGIAAEWMPDSEEHLR